MYLEILPFIYLFFKGMNLKWKQETNSIIIKVIPLHYVFQFKGMHLNWKNCLKANFKALKEIYYKFKQKNKSIVRGITWTPWLSLLAPMLLRDTNKLPK